MSNFFCEKFAKNVKTGAILANFSFFVKFFAEKSRKVSNSREKLPKMVESDFNVAKCAFFVNVSPFVGQSRRILPVREQASPNYSHWGTRALAGDRPPRYGEKSVPFTVGRGPVPRRASGEETALAGVRFSRGSCARGGQAPALRARRGSPRHAPFGSRSPNYSHWGPRAIAGDRPPRYG